MNVQSKKPDRAARALIEAGRSIDALIARFRPGRLLHLHAGPDSIGPVADTVPRQTVRIGPESGSDVRCSINALPFVEGSFDMVVVTGLLSDGRETILDEAQRVLAGGGQLLISGAGWLSTGAHKRDGVSLRPMQLARRMRHRAFDIRQWDGMGLAGTKQGVSHFLLRPLTPLCEQILIRGRHRDEKPIVTPLRFRNPRPAVGRAALDTVSREAV